MFLLRTANLLIRRARRLFFWVCVALTLGCIGIWWYVSTLPLPRDRDLLPLTMALTVVTPIAWFYYLVSAVALWFTRRPTEEEEEAW
jgi:bacteriorhodopsin